MEKTKILLLGCRADLDLLANSITEQFSEVKCEYRGGSRADIENVSAANVDLVIFNWKNAGSRETFDALINRLKADNNKTPVLVVSNSPLGDVAMHALKAGAIDCLCRPHSIARLVFLVGALTIRADRRRAELVPAANGDDAPVFSQSPKMRRLMDALRMAARSEAGILLTGETGTGKNRLATYVHRLSAHRHESLLTVDCGASSEALIESELFGHVRGAFTGADRDHVGKLERVGKGTVMLDEIDCLPMRCQSRLLRVLEERLFEKVGDERTRRFEGRVIALTNSALKQQVEEGKFRKDLYYRLNVIGFEVPPLRERSEDVAPLARHFLERLTDGNPKNFKFSHDSLGAMRRYSWPGNAREVRNVVECALALCNCTLIEPCHLNLPRAESERREERREECREERREERHGRHISLLADARMNGEREELKRVLEDAGNNRTRAARSLGISRSAFYKRLGKLELS